MIEVIDSAIAEGLKKRDTLLEERVFSVAPDVGRTIIFLDTSRSIVDYEGQKTFEEIQLSVLGEIATKICDEENARKPDSTILVKETTRLTIQDALDDEDVSSMIFVGNGGANFISASDRSFRGLVSAFDFIGMVKHLKTGSVCQVGPCYVPGAGSVPRPLFLPPALFATSSPAKIKLSCLDIVGGASNWQERYGLESYYTDRTELTPEFVVEAGRQFASVEYTNTYQGRKWLNYGLEVRGYPFRYSMT